MSTVMFMIVSEGNYEFSTQFLGADFQALRFGTDGNVEKAAELMKEWDKKAHVIGLGDVKFSYTIGSNRIIRRDTETLIDVGKNLQTPVTIGTALRRGVEIIIDTTPKILKQVVGVNVLEAMIMSALDRSLALTQKTE